MGTATIFRGITDRVSGRGFLLVLSGLPFGRPLGASQVRGLFEEMKKTTKKRAEGPPRRPTRTKRGNEGTVGTRGNEGSRHFRHSIRSPLQGCTCVESDNPGRWPGLT